MQRGPGPATGVTIERWSSTGLVAESDSVATEEPLEVRIHGQPLVVLMRTPGDDEDLVRGFLVTEGIAKTSHDIVKVRSVEAPDDRTPGNRWDVTLAAKSDPPFGSRNFFASSACGVCGKASIEAVLALRPKVDSTLRVRGAVIRALPAALRAAQPTFERTGGLHAAALFDVDGNMALLREDVGRHNAVDKVVGALGASMRPASACILQVSGRAGFEIVQKAAVAGIPIVSAVGAPSSLAVDLAERAGVTLLGFVRENGFNIYSHPARVAHG
ncbi:MAG: formate dehydrogenase accessory sulfurtransferase FdhD [Thermoplasmatota archaeon]